MRLTTSACILMVAQLQMARIRSSSVELEQSPLSPFPYRNELQRRVGEIVNCTLFGDDLQCLNGGKCAEGHDVWSETNQGALCDCGSAFEITNEGETLLFVGRSCEIPVLEYCKGKDSMDKRNFCVNDGDCRNEAENFDDVPCRCPDGFVGRHCEYDARYVLPDCPLSCSDHGECEWGLSPFVNVGANVNLDLDYQGSHQYAHCICDSGFAGVNCEYEHIKCPFHKLKHYCFHGSICKQVSGVGDDAVYECECSTVQRKKVAGDFCEFEATDYCTFPLEPNRTDYNAEFAMDDPDDAYCVNNGVCVQAEGGPFYCDCIDGRHEGKHCEDVMEPAPSPTQTLAPTVRLTETMRPTELASVTEWPTEESTFSPTSTATSESTNLSEDDGIPKGAKVGIAFFVIGFVTIIVCVAAYLRGRASMVNEVTFQGEAYDINPSTNEVV